jgi:hypothetical protein
MLVAWRAEVHGVPVREERCLKIIPLHAPREQLDRLEPRGTRCRRDGTQTVGTGAGRASAPC